VDVINDSVGRLSSAENGPEAQRTQVNDGLWGSSTTAGDDFIDPLQSLTQLARRAAMGRWSNGVMPPLVSSVVDANQMSVVPKTA